MSAGRAVLLTERPYAAVVNSQHWDGQLCFSCFLPLSIKSQMCSGCRQAWYCDRECQLRDWQSGQHQMECQVFQMLAGRPLEPGMIVQNEVLRLVARVLSRREEDGGRLSKEEASSDLISDLPAGYLDTLNCDTSRLPAGCLSRAWDLFRFLFHCHEFFRKVSQKDFNKVLALVELNAYAIYDQDLHRGHVDLGSGLYLHSVSFAHSCDPDLDRFMVGAQRRIVLLKPYKNISGGDWKKLTVTFCQDFGSGVALTAARKKLLMENFHINCKCSLCKDQELDMKKRFVLRHVCPACDEPLVLNQAQKKPQLQCYRCQISMDIQYRELGQVQNSLKMVEDRRQSILFTELEQAAKFLHPIRNVLLMQRREEKFQELFSVYLKGNLRQVGTLDDIIDLGKQINSSYEFYGVRSATQAVLCFQLGQLLMAQRPEAATQWFLHTRRLWSLLSSAEHHCIKEINQIIYNSRKASTDV